MEQAAVTKFSGLDARSTTILGINNNEDASAALVVGGQLVAAVQEERFSREKLKKCWPTKSIDYVLEQAACKITDVDIVAYGVAGKVAAYEFFPRYIARLREETHPDAIETIRSRIESEVLIDATTVDQFTEFATKHDLHDKVLWLSHHESHGIGAYSYSPFRDALVLTSDGRGDFESLTVYKVSNGCVEKLHSELTVDSIGYFYSIVTVLLGYRPYRHEGKVTGLAAHGNPEVCLPLMKKMIDVENGRVRSSCGDFYNPSMDCVEELSEAIINEAALYSASDMAAAAQAHLEGMICSLIEKYLDPSRPVNVCLSGGTFGNVLLNQKIAELKGVAGVYVVPFMGDGGQSACAAGAAHFQIFGEKARFHDLFLGPEACHSDNLPDVFQTFSGVVECRELDDPARQVIRLLHDNKVIAIVKGRMEFGPRALCNRSIVYHAKDTTVNHWLNKRLNRTEFMPFAPVVAESLAPLCFEAWSTANVNSYYMTMTFGCTELMKEACPAVVHVDGTARPQIISRESDTLMFDILTDWYSETGQPSLINTSYNRHEEPIICTLREAISPLIDGVVDAVLFDARYLLTRTS